VWGKKVSLVGDRRERRQGGRWIEKAKGFGDLRRAFYIARLAYLRNWLLFFIDIVSCVFYLGLVGSSNVNERGKGLCVFLALIKYAFHTPPPSPPPPLNPPNKSPRFLFLVS